MVRSFVLIASKKLPNSSTNSMMRPIINLHLMIQLNFERHVTTTQTNVTNNQTKVTNNQKVNNGLCSIGR
jgi:hypothetical protein